VQHLAEFAATGQAKAMYRRQFIRAGSKPDHLGDPLLYVPTNPSRTLKTDLKAAGIPVRTEEGKIDFHALRVAFVSFVVETGTDLKTAQSLARHTTPELTMNVYARVRGSRLTEVAEAVGRIILPLTSTKEAQRNLGGSASHFFPIPCQHHPGASIPAASTISALFTAGQNLPNPRQIESQPGQSQEVTRVFPVEEGTVTALQQSHPRSITSMSGSMNRRQFFRSGASRGL
jgi:hypothetical protein